MGHARNFQDAESIRLINQNAVAISEGLPKVELDSQHYERTAVIWKRKQTAREKPIFTLIGGEILNGNVFEVMWFGIVINLALAFVNLLPIPPLDGFQIVKSVIPKRMKTQSNPWPGRIVGLLTILVLLYSLADFLYAMYFEFF